MTEPSILQEYSDMLTDIWSSLQKVKHLSGTVLSLKDTPIRYHGEGTVTVEQPDDTNIYFKEFGKWDNNNNSTDFTNHYHWQLNKDDNTLKLSHLRQGEANEVLLGTFISTEKGLHIDQPHLCKEDLYMATLVPHKDHLLLTWDVMGPQKNDRIHWRYFG